MNNYRGIECLQGYAVMRVFVTLERAGRLALSTTMSLVWVLELMGV